MADPTPHSFEADPGVVYEVIDGFFRALVDSGVEHVCVSPGSRSTPLCVTADQTEGLRTWVGLDERATSFFALGLAKASGRPVALVCTSGTAAANYLPAVVEAHYSGVPLLLLTADRPPELRDWGAGQTIEQVGLYGAYCRWAVDVPLPEAGPGGLRYATQLAARATNASLAPRPGPVHLNWPLREPLPPPPGFFERDGKGGSLHPLPTTPMYSSPAPSADEASVVALTRLAEGASRGVLCVGPRSPGGGSEKENEFAAALAAFATATGWPIFADPASGLRGNHQLEGAPLISAGDGILRAPGWTERMQPEVVLRFGETPVCKAQRLWIEAAEPEAVWWFGDEGSWGEPSHRATHVVRGDATPFLRGAVERLNIARRSSNWCQAFEAAERTARSALASHLKDEQCLSGAAAAATVLACCADDGWIFASNSMSIRLLDLVQGPSTRGPRIVANRGASGIDGINSTAMGIAAARSEKTVLLTGDLALLHDLSGLMMAKEEAIDLVIVVLDDDGGGIFSYLPIAAQGEQVSFEKLFGTPHGVEIERVAALFDLPYARVTTPGALAESIQQFQSASGVAIVHVPLDRDANTSAYRALIRDIVESVDGMMSA